jgi:hypothetical protein
MSTLPREHDRDFYSPRYNKEHDEKYLLMRKAGNEIKIVEIDIDDLAGTAISKLAAAPELSGKSMSGRVVYMFGKYAPDGNI